ncbi:Serine/threonine protein kinase [Giardia duodenalis]|uniref:Serine/threonine protein kinase n=1 Tax=Giardia intestinalis TaxID=5741 RepID=V6TJR7_GIAIN|nr:Serine/threonine protein kinase [Giardia intestinalis]
MSEFEQLYEKIHVKPPFNEEKVVPVVHRESGRICAHMRIPLSTLTDSSRSLVDKEIMIMARLTHPAVSSFKQVIYAQDAIHIVMDYHGVETLQDFIDRHRELSKIVDEATIWSIAAQLLDCVVYLHSMFKANADGVSRVYHQHISPANITIDPLLNLRLIDFQGIRLARDSTYRQTLARYSDVAPEMRSGAPGTDRSDIWAIGATLYYLATLTPFMDSVASTGYVVDTSNSPHAFQLNNYSSELVKFITLLCADSPADRPSASDLIQYPAVRSALQDVEAQRRLAQTPEKDPYLRQAYVASNVKTVLMQAAEFNDPVRCIHRINYEARTKLAETNETALQLALNAGNLQLAHLLTPLEGYQLPLTHEMLVRTPRKTELMLAAESGNIIKAWHFLNAQANILDVNGKTALMYAAEWGYISIVRLLILKESRLSMRDCGSTALMLATRNGHSLVARILADRESRLVNKQGMSALIFAVYRGDVPLVQTLVDKESRITDRNGDTALLHAVRLLTVDETVYGIPHASLLEIIKLLAPREARFISTRDKRSALMIAAEQNCYEAVSILAEYETHLRTSKGWTALMLAAKSGAVQAAQILAEKEAGSVSYNNTCAFKIAALNGQTEICKILYNLEGPLVETTFGFSFMSLAATINNYQYIEMYKEHFLQQRDADGTTALMLSAIGNHIETTKILLNDEAGLTRKDGETALSLALKAGSFDTAALLLRDESGTIEVSNMESGRKTDLMRAASSNDIVKVFYLKDSQGRLTDLVGKTALMYAAEAGHLPAIKILAPIEATMTVQQNNKFMGMCALSFAIDKKHLHVVRYLLKYEKDCVDGFKQTALMRAARINNREAVEMLLPYLAKRRNDMQWTSLMLAVSEKCVDAVRILVHSEATERDDKGMTALMRAVQLNHVEIADILIPYEAMLTKDDGTTALMVAASKGYLDLVKLLHYREGGRVTRDGTTALMLASEVGCTEAVSLLLDTEAGRKSNKGWTALIMAAQNGHADCVRVLKAKEARERDSMGWSALIWASAKGHLKVVMELRDLEAGGKRATGGTAMMAAAERGHVAVVKALMDYEAGMQDSDGKTATIYAAINGHAPIVRLLAEKEANLCDTLKQTALMFAVQNKHADCIRLLIDFEQNSRDIYGKAAADMTDDPAIKKLFESSLSASTALSRSTTCQLGSSRTITSGASILAVEAVEAAAHENRTAQS